jgi:hypothetical protein
MGLCQVASFPLELDPNRCRPGVIRDCGRGPAVLLALGSQLLKRAEETANLSRMCGRLASAGKYIDNPVGAPYLLKDEGELFTDALPATGGHGAQRCGTFQFHQDLIWA